MAFTEDLDEFLSTSDFAVSALLNGVTTVNVIFDKEYFEGGAGFAGVQSNQPKALGKTSDFSSVVHGHTLVISGTTYNVVGVEPDGTGMTTLRLEKQ